MWRKFPQRFAFYFLKEELAKLAKNDRRQKEELAKLAKNDRRQMIKFLHLSSSTSITEDVIMLRGFKK